MENWFWFMFGLQMGSASSNSAGGSGHINPVTWFAFNTCAWFIICIVSYLVMVLPNNDYALTHKIGVNLCIISGLLLIVCGIAWIVALCR